jgi:hypothetical protein
MIHWTPMKYRYFAKMLWRAAAQIRQLDREPLRPGERTVKQWACGLAREAAEFSRLASANAIQAEVKS